MTSEPEPLLRVGGNFGDFNIVEELGVGGMGSVYRVRDPETGEDYAVKVMHPVISARDFERRFIREAEIAMNVRHPNLVHVYDVGRDPDTGLAYMVMDYVSGGSLRGKMAQKLMSGERFTVREALGVVRKIAEALSAAAAAGVVHRDVKPDNILFDAAGNPVLADLGVAKVDDDSATVLTMSNVVVGTPAYMAPEQLLSAHGVDSRADVYSLGIVLWEMLAGERPNSDASQSELLASAVRGDRIPDIRTKRPKTPRYVVELLRRMCDPRLTHRFASPDEVVRFLEEWRIIEARRFRTFLVWFAVVMTLAVAAVVALGVRMIGGNAPSSADVLEKSDQDDSPESEFSIPNAVD